MKKSECSVNSNKMHSAVDIDKVLKDTEGNLAKWNTGVITQINTEGK